MLTLAMNKIAKIQDTIVSKHKITSSCSMSNIDNKNNETNTNDYDELDSTEIRSKTFLPEPMPKMIEYKEQSFKGFGHTHSISLSTHTNVNESKLLFTLKTLDLEGLYGVFIRNSINFNDLFLLTRQDLVEMNIAIGPRNRLLYFAEEYRKIAKEYTIKEVNEFFRNNKFLAINQVELERCSKEEKGDKGIIHSYFDINYNNNHHLKRELPSQYLCKQPYESSQSNRKGSDELKESYQNDIRQSCRNKKHEDYAKGNKTTKEIDHEGLMKDLLDNNLKQQPQQGKKLRSNSIINLTNQSIKPNSNSSFSQQANQRYDVNCKQSFKISQKDSQHPLNQKRNGSKACSQQSSTSAIHSHHTPITFANNEEPQINELNFSLNEEVDEDSESIRYSDGKTSNQIKDSYSTKATLKQAAISKPLNKTGFIDNANNLFAEVESFQHQYETMKKNNNQRKNRVNSLLKREGNDIKQKINSSNSLQSKSISSNPNSIKINKDNCHFHEIERKYKELMKG